MFTVVMDMDGGNVVVNRLEVLNIGGVLTYDGEEDSDCRGEPERSSATLAAGTPRQRYRAP